MARDLKLERFYPHPQAEVWEAITDGQTLARWLSARDFAARVGHDFTLKATSGPGFDGQVRCRVLAVEEPNTLSFTWRGGPVDTVVTFRLTPEGSGTRLSMEQTGFHSTASVALLPLIQLWWDGSLQSSLGLTAAATTASLSVGTVGTVGALGSGVAGAAMLVAFAGFFAVRPTPAEAIPTASVRAGTPAGQTPAAPEPTPASAQPARRAPIEASVGQTSAPGEGAARDDAPLAEPAPAAPAAPAPFEGAVAVEAGPRATGSLNYYETALPTTLNPLFARSMVDVRTHELVFDRLFYAAADGIRSKLVTGYTLSDDGRAISVDPLPEIRWHDGRPFGPADICFTVSALVDPAVATTQTRYRGVLAGCEVTGESATIRFADAVADPRVELDFYVLPAHGFKGGNPSDEAFATRPIGTGPMKAKQARYSVKLEAFPNAHHNARIAELNLYEGGDPLVQVRTLVNGGVDGIVDVGARHAREVDPATARLVTYPMDTLWYAGVDPAGVLADASLRRAAVAAVGRDGMIEVGMGGAATPVTGPDGDPLPGEPDLDLVNRAMAEAGAVREGGIWHRDGEPVTVRVGMREALDPPATGLVSLLGNQLRAAGFSVHVVPAVAPGDGSHGCDLLVDAWTDARPYPFAADDPEHPAIFLFRRDRTSVWSLRVKGVEIAPHHYFTEFDRWSL